MVHVLLFTIATILKRRRSRISVLRPLLGSVEVLQCLPRSWGFGGVGGGGDGGARVE